MPFSFKKLVPHLIVLVVLIIASLAYFSPVMQGKQLFQSDIAQYTGMAKQLIDHREATGEEIFWTDNAFGGMPTYQLGARYPHNYIKKLDLTLRFLPRPADYLFLYFVGMYILFLVLKVDYKLALLGALAFGFSTYLIIILGVGHNAKAHAIAYMPFVLSGIILTFQGKFLSGFLLTTVAVALELVANHFQMTYYLFFVIICLGVAYLIDAVKKNMLPHYFKSVGLLALAAVLALGFNSTNILATKEYADTSTRGKSELTINADGSLKENVGGGLDYDYITTYSYGKLETFNLFIPRFMGGGSGDPLPKESEAFNEVLRLGATPQEANQLLSQIPAYWGDQPIVAAPAYIGAVVIFLAVLALFLVKGRLKWWVLAAFLIGLLLSWGKNFNGLTQFFIDYVPLYNKFRAVSSIQVIVELVLPILAVVGLQQYFNDFHKTSEKKKALLYATGIVGGLSLIFILFKGTLFNFASPYDAGIREQIGQKFMDAVRADRATLMVNDTLRSLAFVLLTAGVLWLFLKEKLKETVAIGIMIVLVLVDLVGVNRRYVNNDDFVSARIMEQPFQQDGADRMILEDKNGHYRVFDATTDAFNSGAANYYHKSLGGYHAAKPGRMNELAEFYINKGDIGILNMLNVRYIKTQREGSGPVAQRNPYANGNAWFVENVVMAQNANEEIQFLDSLNTKKTAVIHEEFKDLLPLEEIVRDSTASIDLVNHTPEHLTYEVATTSPQLAIFSEVYYPDGWNAYLDGAPISHFRANYTLRAMTIPKGVHTIDFKFEPQVIKTGSTITLASSLAFLFIFVGGIIYRNRKKKTEANS